MRDLSIILTLIFFGDMMNGVNLADLGILFYFIVNSIRVYLKLKDLTPSFITL